MDREVRMIVDKVIKRETDSMLDATERVMSEMGKSRPSKTQIRNLLDVAYYREAASLREICEYIDYLWGKEKMDRKNKNNRNKNISSANKIKVSLEEEVKEIMNAIKEEAGEMDSAVEKEKQGIELLIAEKYFGYLYWKFTVNEAEKGKSNGGWT